MNLSYREKPEPLMLANKALHLVAAMTLTGYGFGLFSAAGAVPSAADSERVGRAQKLKLDKTETVDAGDSCDSISGKRTAQSSSSDESRHHHMGFFGRHPLDLSNLNLTDTQKQRIKDLHAQNAEKTKDLHKQLLSLRIEFRQMMFDPNISEEQIRTKGKALRRLQDKMEDAQLSDFLAVKALLTTDQKQKLADAQKSSSRVASNKAATDALTSNGASPSTVGANAAVQSGAADKDKSKTSN